VNWTSPEVVTFEGFGPQEINWAQIVRITEPAAIAAIVAANEQTGVWTRRNENAAEQRPEPYR
jgi:hypothetical protein